MRLFGPNTASIVSDKNCQNSNGFCKTVSSENFRSLSFSKSTWATLPIDFIVQTKKLSKDKSLNVNVAISKKKTFQEMYVYQNYVYKK